MSWIETVLSILKMAYLYTYPPDGCDPVNIKHNGKNLLADHYLFHPLTIVTSFLGLPNRDLDEINQQSVRNLTKNLIGWEDNVSIYRQLWNALLILPVTAWNLMIAVIRFATNIIKLVTEFIPMMISGVTVCAAAWIWNQLNDVTNPVMRGFLITAYLGLYALHYAADLFYIVGRAMTSPHKSVRVAYRRGMEYFGDTWLGMLIGCLMAIGSIAITVGIYALIFPIAIKYAVAITLPHVPAAMMVLINHAANIILPLLSLIGKTVLMPALKPVFHAIGLTVSPAIVAVSALTGVVITTIGTVTSKLIENFKNWWFSCSKEENEPQPVRKKHSNECSIHREKTRVQRENPQKPLLSQPHIGGYSTFWYHKKQNDGSKQEPSLIQNISPGFRR